MRTPAWFLSVAVGVGAAAGCSKSSGNAGDLAASARSTSPATVSSAETSPAAASSATASLATASTSMATSSSAAVSLSATSLAAAASSFEPPAGPPGLVDASCGTKPKGCILRDWMKGNAAPAIVAGDFDALREALGEAATFAPPGYPNWASIARDGADAARMQDLEAVKAACRSCHAQYRDRYRRDLHDRRL